MDDWTWDWEGRDSEQTGPYWAATIRRAGEYAGVVTVNPPGRLGPGWMVTVSGQERTALISRLPAARVPEELAQGLVYAISAEASEAYRRAQGDVQHWLGQPAAAPHPEL